MRTYLLQDYTTLVRPSANPAVTVVQSDEAWLELTGARDVIFHAHFVEATSGVSLSLQTSPTADDELFATIAQFTPDFSYSSHVYLSTIKAQYATIPPNKFMRWVATGPVSTAWTMTFRAYLSVNFSTPQYAVMQNGIYIESLP